MIEKHAAVEDNCIVDFYRSAFKSLKEDLSEEEKGERRKKEGPVGYAAPEAAALLERDGPRGNLITKVAQSYARLREVLATWEKFGTWIIVYPMVDVGEVEILKDVINLVKKHIEEGGQVVTAWTPITEQNLPQWRAMMELWKTLDSTFQKFAAAGQMSPTASSTIKDGKLFLEAGCPEGSAQFYRTYGGVAAAKHLYDAIRKKAPNARLPEMASSENVSMGASTPRRGGMWERRSSPPRKQRRQL
ncbi:unnamed protein product [Nippostrongylus brasiliensis]|uniref:Aldolase n=1 Tax=Nippostrongylus brasiliensis TaxID=27835 RepID=A0A0N4YC29_NIPBR|nr:unnamed protein product [Nippostrongylus brasiliensis]